MHYKKSILYIHLVVHLHAPIHTLYVQCTCTWALQPTLILMGLLNFCLNPRPNIHNTNTIITSNTVHVHACIGHVQYRWPHVHSMLITCTCTTYIHVHIIHTMYMYYSIHTSYTILWITLDLRASAPLLLVMHACTHTFGQKVYSVSSLLTTHNS